MSDRYSKIMKVGREKDSYTYYSSFSSNICIDPCHFIYKSMVAIGKNLLLEFMLKIKL